MGRHTSLVIDHIDLTDYHTPPPPVGKHGKCDHNGYSMILGSTNEPRFNRSVNDCGLQCKVLGCGRCKVVYALHLQSYNCPRHVEVNPPIILPGAITMTLDDLQEVY